MDSKVKNGELEDKVAFVTGGTTGIGYATVELFLREGAKVVFVGKNMERLSEANKRLTEVGGDRVIAVRCDVRNEDEIIHAYNELMDRFGKLDIVVNNAGITYSAPIEETSLEKWENINAVNSTGYFLVAREGYKIFKRQMMGGTFVFVASDNALRPSTQSVAYNVSKAAELHLSRTIAHEGGKYGIRSNSVLPGAVFGISNLWTDEYREARASVHGFDPDKLEEEYKKANAMGVVIYPEEVAWVILFLSSERSAKMTGNLLVIDGGQSGSYAR